MNETYIQGVVPRWVFQGNLTNLYNRWSLSNVIMLDSQLENRYSLGRNLKLNNLSLNVNMLFYMFYINKHEIILN